MQEDELTSNEREAVLNEDQAKGGAIPSENQLIDKIAAPPAEGQEGEPSSSSCSFIYIFIFLCYASCDLQYVFISAADAAVPETTEAREASEVSTDEINLAESEQTASQQGE